MVPDNGKFAGSGFDDSHAVFAVMGTARAALVFFSEALYAATDH